MLWQIFISQQQWLIANQLPCFILNLAKIIVKIMNLASSACTNKYMSL